MEQRLKLRGQFQHLNSVPAGRVRRFLGQIFDLDLLSPGLLWSAIRPRTLSMAVVPVIVGSALAWHEGVIPDWLLFVIVLLVAVAIQAGTNLFNDASDAERGNDGPDRRGPLRVTGSGLATATQVKQTAWLTFGLALLGGIYLVIAGGWPILAIGLTSLVAGWAYSGGPRPLSYTAWGEVFVVSFFGVAAAVGSYYLQSDHVNLSIFVVGMALGLHAAAVLLLNNLRDYQSDRRVGRRTLVILISPKRACWLYAAMLLLPFALLATVLDMGLAWGALPFCAWLAWRCNPDSSGPTMNRRLGMTALAQSLLGGLLTLSLLTSFL